MLLEDYICMCDWLSDILDILEKNTDWTINRQARVHQETLINKVDMIMANNTIEPVKFEINSDEEIGIIDLENEIYF